MQVSEFVREALDPVRLAVLGHAVAGPIDVDELVDELGVSRRKLLSVVVRLQRVGLLDDEGRLDRQTLVDVATALPGAEPASERVVDGPWTADEQVILKRFFQGDRLAEIPTARSKRLVVLERLAQEFAPGIRYEEPQVNFALQMFHHDYAALRRYLVDEGFMTRADGVYWRSGGRYDDASGAETDA